MSILIVTGGYLPGYRYGGPVRSIAAIVHQLGDQFDFRIVTGSTDLGLSEPYPGVALNTWTHVGKAQVWYSSGNQLLPSFWRRITRDTNPQLVYLNSYFHPVSIAFRLWRRLGIVNRSSVLLAPRGEFSPGALAQRSSKKKLLLRFAKLLGLNRSVVFQASTPHEKEDIHRALGAAVEVVVAPNLAIPVDALPSSRIKSPSYASFAWISRISPKKNLKGAISLLADAHGNASFNVYGPVEDTSYWKSCKQAIETLPKGVHVEYEGELQHAKVAAALNMHEFFLFPTLGENFGHVIAEALSQGLPILVSDQTPWRNLEAAGVGWDLPLDDTDRWSEVINYCIEMNDEEYQAMSIRCREYVRIWLDANGGTKATSDMFSSVMGSTIKS